MSNCLSFLCLINARSGLLGKKAKEIDVSLHQTAVALYASAWIETYIYLYFYLLFEVALYASAWIETSEFR